MKILVTGSNGQLGSEIKFLSSKYDYDFVFIDSNQLDFRKTESIVTFLERSKPDFIINCGAYTAVDKAEEEPDMANLINNSAPKEIARYCKESGSRLIHISTDYVFNGRFDLPITENDYPNPLSVYGKTKLSGEQAVLNTDSNAYIIRTSWVYSKFGNNFVKTMVKLGNERSEVSVVCDQFGTPTWARDLAEVSLQIVNQVCIGNDVPGIYHFSNEGETSWYNFAQEIMKVMNLKCTVKPIATKDYPTIAVRPHYSVLDKSKIKSLLRKEIPNWKVSLINCLNDH